MSRNSFFIFGKALSTRKTGKANLVQVENNRKLQTRYAPTLATQKQPIKSNRLKG